jgi:hypothetical protein
MNFIDLMFLGLRGLHPPAFNIYTFFVSVVQLLKLRCKDTLFPITSVAGC